MTVRVEEIQARSVTVRLESEEPSSSETRSTIQGLEPDTEFCLRVVSFNKEGDLDESELQFSTLKDNIDEARDRQSPLTNSSSGLCSNPSLHEDESNNVHKSCSEENGDKDNTEHCNAGEVESELEEERLVKRKANKIDGRDLLVTPCKRDISKGKQGGNKRFKSRTISVNEKPEINNAANGVGDKDEKLEL